MNTPRPEGAWPAQRGAKAAIKADPVDYRQLSAYDKAFADRVASTSKEAMT
jgi:hypothetical protein